MEFVKIYPKISAFKACLVLLGQYQDYFHLVRLNCSCEAPIDCKRRLQEVRYVQVETRHFRRTENQAALLEHFMDFKIILEIIAQNFLTIYLICLNIKNTFEILTN